MSECALINNNERLTAIVEKHHAAYAIVERLLLKKDNHTLLGRAPFEWSFNASSAALFQDGSLCINYNSGGNFKIRPLKSRGTFVGSNFACKVGFLNAKRVTLLSVRAVVRALASHIQ